MRRLCRSSPNWKIASASSCSDAPFTRSAAVGPADWSIRMSSGSSRRKLNPRPSASSCIDDTPRSARMPSTALEATRVEHRVERPVVRVHRLEPIAERRERFLSQPQRLRIAVQSDHPFSASLQQRPRVSAEAERAVHVSPAAPGLQKRQHLVEQYRLVKRRDVVPRPSSLVLRPQIPNSARAPARRRQ